MRERERERACGVQKYRKCAPLLDVNGVCMHAFGDRVIDAQKISQRGANFQCHSFCPCDPALYFKYVLASFILLSNIEKRKFFD